MQSILPSAKECSSKPLAEYRHSGLRTFRRVEMFFSLLIVAACFIAYHNSFRCPFIFDDVYALVDSSRIRHLGMALSKTVRPLVDGTFALNYAWGGLEVWGFHFVNVAIHTLAALALYGVVRRTLRLPSPVVTGDFRVQSESFRVV